MNDPKVKITITNDYHGTSYNIWARRSAGGSLLITRARAEHCKNTLCGVDCCQCGDDIGSRPSVCPGINPNDDFVEVFVEAESAWEV